METFWRSPKSPTLDLMNEIQLVFSHVWALASEAARAPGGSDARGSRAAFMDRYAADLKRLAERDDLPADARCFDSHCHLEAWNSIRAGIWLTAHFNLHFAGKAHRTRLPGKQKDKTHQNIQQKDWRSERVPQPMSVGWGEHPPTKLARWWQATGHWQWTGSVFVTLFFAVWFGFVQGFVWFN